MTHRLIRPLAAVFVGASTTLSFAPYQIWPLAILSPLLLFCLLHQRSSKQAAWTGFLWGLGLFSTGISWVHISIDTFGGMPKIASLFLMALLVIYLSLFPALFAGLLNRFKLQHTLTMATLATPALWLAVEYLRGWALTGFPWLALGYSQIDAPTYGLAPIGGVDLITFVLVAMAASLAFIFSHQQWKLIWVPLGTFLLASLTSLIQWVEPETEAAQRIALVQGNIQQELKWLPSQRWPTLMMYLDYTRENWDADIIIWPEAAIPAFEHEINSYMSNLDELARLNHSAVVTGVLTRTDEGEYYNSVTSIGDVPHGEYQYAQQPRYHKHHLLPFGEFVPLEEWLRPLAPFFNLPMSSFQRGDYIQDNIVAGSSHMVVALCYEIIFGQQLRDNITPQTDYVLTLSNDAWFGDSIGPWQHMEIARMRALEFGKPVIRATNNGVTAITDHQGRITAALPQFTREVLRAEVTPTTGETPYVRFGGLPLKVMVFGVLGLVLGVRMRESGKA